MKTSAIAAGALVCAATTSAFAQGQPAAEPPPFGNPPPPSASRDVRDVLTAPVQAPRGAVELGVEAGYTQGFGAPVADPRVGAGPGGTIGLSLDDRIDPHWSLGVGGQYQGYGSTGTSATTVRGVTAGMRGTYHFSPYTRLDPHVSLGAGYRLFAESPPGDAPTTLTHGIDVGRVEVGVDVRPNDSVAISPVIGADLNLFAWRTSGGVEAVAPMSRTLSTFIFAGVEGRFDLGGTRQAKPTP